MEILVYLFKVNIAIVLLYGFYKLFFQRDTFFQCKRFLLLGIFFIALLYPFCNLTQQLVQSKNISRIIESGISIPSFYLDEVVVVAEAPAEKPADGTTGQEAIIQKNPLPWLLLGMYGLGVLALLAWMIIQISSICIRVYKSTPGFIAGRKVYQSEGITTPFSFFRWIVLNPTSHKENELTEILMHEEAHVQQYHSIDMLICEWVCIICWFNPFVWLMKKDIRMNLEYLADRSVIDSGCDSEHYQFHLLRLSYHKAAVKLSNNFNVSPLKKRIKMMNKKKTSWFGLTKYALFLPLVAALLIFNSLQAVSNEIRSMASEAILTGTELALYTPESEKFIPVETTKPAKTETVTSPATVTQKKSTDTTQKKEKVILDRADVAPEFPGGEKELFKWLSNNLVYPTTAQEEGIQGRVLIRFVVAPDGSIENVEIEKALAPSCDREAVRVVKEMPKWIPGKQGGENVYVYFHLPLYFRLSTAKDSGKDKTSTDNQVTIIGYGRNNDSDKDKISTDNIIYQIEGGKELSKSEFEVIEKDKIKSTKVEYDVTLPNGKKGKRITIGLK